MRQIKPGEVYRLSVPDMGEVLIGVLDVGNVGSPCLCMDFPEDPQHIGEVDLVYTPRIAMFGKRVKEAE